MKPSLIQSASALLHCPIHHFTPLSGGSLSQVILIDYREKQKAVVKSGPFPQKEAIMLQVLKERGIPVPEVIQYNDEALILSFCEGQPDISHAWNDMAEVISTLHSVDSNNHYYGWDTHYAFSDLPILNTPTHNWVDFWRENRLLTHIPFIPASLANRIEHLAGRLENIIPSNPPPVLLHGDLWEGNILTHYQRISALLDPACYYGHAEVDLAMLTLFNSSNVMFLQQFFPHTGNFKERLAVYQLWPALVHLRLFGISYQKMVEAILAKILF